MELLGNPTGNICLATRRDHEFLLCQKGNVSNVSNNPNKYKRSNFVDSSINQIYPNIQITSPTSSDPLHPTYNSRKRDAQAEYLVIIKMTLRNSFDGINFMDPVQIGRVHRDLMN